MRGAHWGGHREGGTEIFEGGTCPHVPPPSDAPVLYITLVVHYSESNLNEVTIYMYAFIF